jgi:uncharacterized membrane protein
MSYAHAGLPAGAVPESFPTSNQETAGMSNLVAIAYPDANTAEEVRTTLAQMMKERLIEMDDAVVVTRDDDGKVKLHQAASTGAAGAAGGALWGGLIGLLFLSPLLGAAIGAAAGGATGALADVGVDDNFMKELGAKLTPGTAALIVLVRKSTPDKVVPRIAHYGGHVIQSSLSHEAEASLDEALNQPAAVA